MNKQPEEMVPDLLAALDELAGVARRAQQSLEDGTSLNGRGALQKIQHRASDVARHAREDLGEPEVKAA